MERGGGLLMVATLALLQLPVQVFAQTDIFMKIEGMPGESYDDRHLSEIDVDSLTKVILDDGGQTGCLSGLIVVKNLDKSSPFLEQAAVSKSSIGAGSPVAIIARRNSGYPLEYYRLYLEGVKVVGYRVDITDGNFPSEKIGLTFTSAEFVYVPQKIDGSAGAPISVSLAPSICPESLFQNGFEAAGFFE